MFRPLTASMVLCAGLLLMTGSAATASPWPSGSTGTDIGGDLPSGFEPSGIAWDDFTGALWVVDDEGQLARMLDDGTSTDTWTLSAGLDLESVAVTGTTQKLYLGKEYPPTILEYNSSSTGTPTSTGHSWVLGSFDPGATSSDGMEGLTWVPNGYHPYPNSTSGGVFFASSQHNGTIYVYDVNLSVSGSTPALLGSFTPDATQTDVSDLYFSKVTRTLFVLYGNANKMLEIDTTTTSFSIMSSYTLPTSSGTQEGVTLLPQCPGALTNIYIAYDNAAHTVDLFDNFPQLCATTLAATADATTKQASPNSNFGLTSTLTTDSATNDDENFLIRFSLSGVNTAQINRARLLFHVTDGTDLSPQYCGTTASWPETGVTWNNQPVCNTNNLGGGATVANNSWVSYNVLGTLQSGYSSFRFTPRSTNDCVANSRQAGSNQPQLVLWMNQ
jgi:uncharacterized protein YjiK